MGNANGKRSRIKIYGICSVYPRNVRLCFFPRVFLDTSKKKIAVGTPEAPYNSDIIIYCEWTDNIKYYRCLLQSCQQC